MYKGQLPGKMWLWEGSPRVSRPLRATPGSVSSAQPPRHAAAEAAIQGDQATAHAAVELGVLCGAGFAGMRKAKVNGAGFPPDVTGRRGASYRDACLKPSHLGG